MDSDKSCAADELQTGEKTSRFGREATIGVGVIGMLAIVLGVVVVMRLTRAAPDAQVASASEEGVGQAADSPKDDPLFKEFKPKSRTTVVTPMAASKPPMAAPPKTFDSDLDKWKLASDKREPKGPPSFDGAPSLPPPTLPEPTKPARGNRYERVATDPPATPPDFGSPKPRHEKRHAEPSGEASADAGPSLPALPPTPPETPRREVSRYERARPSEPSAPPTYADPTDRPSSPAPAKPVSRYGDDSHRRSENNDRQPESDYRQPDNDLRGGSVYDDVPRRPAPPRDVVPPRRDGRCEVQPNDSFWTIAERVYGAGAYYKALVEHNRKRGIEVEERLRPGDLLYTPPLAELERSYPDLCPKPVRRDSPQSRNLTVGTHRSYRGGRTYTVTEGDTLFNIARYELGKASRWVEIYDLNRDLLGRDFNYLKPGLQLTLPDGDRSDVIAEPPSDRLRR